MSVCVYFYDIMRYIKFLIIINNPIVDSLSTFLSLSLSLSLSVYYIYIYIYIYVCVCVCVCVYVFIYKTDVLHINILESSLLKVFS